MSHSDRSAVRSREFTFAELLVIAAIVAVLITLLLPGPATWSVRSTAQHPVHTAHS